MHIYIKKRNDLGERQHTNKPTKTTALAKHTQGTGKIMDPARDQFGTFRGDGLLAPQPGQRDASGVFDGGHAVPHAVEENGGKLVIEEARGEGQTRDACGCVCVCVCVCV